MVAELQSVTPSAQTIQAAVNSTIASALKTELGPALTSALGASVTVTFLSGPPPANTDEAVEITVSLNPNPHNFTQSVSLGSLNLNNPNFSSLTFSGNGSVTVTVGGSATLDLAYDLTTSQPYLVGDTGFNLNASIASSDLVLSGDIGSVGVSIGNSTTPASIALTDANGDANSSASIVMTVATPSTWIPFGQISSSSGTFQFSTTGGLFTATLPIYVNTPLGSVSPGNLSVAVNLLNPSQSTITLPSNLQSVLDGGGFDFSDVFGAAGVGSFISNLESSVEKQLQQLPIIGNIENFGGIFAELQNQFFPSLAATLGGLNTSDANYLQELQTAVQNAISSLGTIVVPGWGSVTVTQDSEGNLSGLDLSFEVRGTDTYTTSFNTNLGGLGLSVSTQGRVSLALGYDMHLGFEISKTDGVNFLVETDASGKPIPSFSFTVTAGLTPGTQLQAKLIVLNVMATDPTTGPGTNIGGTLAFNLANSVPNLPSDPPANTFYSLPFADLPAALLNSVVSASLSASINLHLVGDIDPTAPGISADLAIQFPLGNVGTEEPTVALNNVTLTFGTFISRIVQPVVNDISGILSPIEPILAFLNGPVPGVSSLIGNFTWAKLLEFVAAYAGDYNFQEFSEFNTAINILNEVANFETDLKALGGSEGINFGNFPLSIDARDTSGPGSIDDTSADSLASSETDDNGDPITAEDIEGDVTGDAGDDGNNENDWSSLSSGGIQFPILEDPKSIVGMLLGKNVDLVTWTLPSVSLDIDFPTIPLAEVTIAIVHAEIDLIGHFDMTLGGNTLGFDTNGLNTGHFADGFYMLDQPVLSLDVGIGVGATRRSGHWRPSRHRIRSRRRVGRADQRRPCRSRRGAQNLFRPAFLGLCDPTVGLALGRGRGLYHGKLYLRQFDAVFRHHSANYAIFFLHLVRRSQPGDRLLRRRHDAEYAQLGANNFAVSQIGGDSSSGYEMQVSAFGETQDFPGVKSIVASGITGGQGSNVFSLDKSVTVPATIVAGGADDEIQGGSGNNTITASGESDQINGRNGNDTITYSGGGFVNIVDGNGNDTIKIQGGGSNYIQVGNGNDSITGGTGNDTIYSGTGNDTITAGTGSGENEVFGPTVPGGGISTITASGAGPYLIEGGTGTNTIDASASSGSAVIYGNGPDTNNSAATGAAFQAPAGGNDTIKGGSGADVLYGGGGQNSIYGGSGSDSIVAAGGNSQIFGSSGNNSIYANSGNDTIYGGSSTWSINCLAGNEVIYGNDVSGNGGYGTIHAGSGSDIINCSRSTQPPQPVGQAPVPAAQIFGDSGSATITGSQYYDVIHAGTGGNSLVHGDGGGDLIFGGGAGDTLCGDSGNASIYGGPGNETLYGGDGLDINVNSNNNGLINAGGDDLSTGSNLLVGGTGNDLLVGDSIAPGHNTLIAGPGNDTLYAGTNGDYLAAGPADDTLIGGPGNDSLQLAFSPNGQALDSVVGEPGSTR